MDPQTLLDSALFQLTPTRTRCDLVVVCGGMNEKLASGLVEPFVSHLKFAKDQIPKGGYSITLRPPKTDDASWFTKATFLRFVRFVSTPEVLERFARLEKEILQIESSVQPNEVSNGNVAGQAAEDGSLSAANGITKQSSNSSKLKGEVDGTNDDVQEENSKIRLQRLLETRKALLRKEQAMAYARALAAGFELDNIDDLILFADAFGASRLREACTDFKELCKKKHNDGLWMDELAAMEAYTQADLSFSGTSGIILACENPPLFQNSMVNFQNNGGKLVSNGSLGASSDSTASQANSDSNKDNNMPASDQIPSTPANVQVQMPWPSQIPQYMFNFQGQQMPPYPAYPFPPMQNVPPYYPPNMHWPQNMDESNGGPTQKPDYHHHQRSSSRKKEKEDEQTESSDSDAGTDSEAIANKKKDRKKSSKTVVIRNINYITSQKRNGEKDEDSDNSSSVDDDLILDEDFLKHKVGDVVGSLEKHRKPNSKNKKRGGNKSSSFGNGFNGSADQELENDPVYNLSEGGKGNENWDSFQNLLMKEKEVDSQQPMDVLDEHFTIKSSIDGGNSNSNALSMQFDSEKVQTRKTFGTDSFVVTERNEVNDGRVDFEDFGSGETFRSGMMKRRDSEEERLLFPRRSEETVSNLVGALPDCGNDSSIIKSAKAEDWFIVNHSVKSESQGVTHEQTMFADGDYATSSEGDRSRIETSKKIVPVDDSFMIQTQTSIGDQYDSHWKTDISLVSDLIVPENGTHDSSQKKIGVYGPYEPDDLSVVLSRDSGFELVGVSWAPEMDYGVEASFREADKKPSVVEAKDEVEEKSPINSKSANGKNNSAKQTRPKVLPGSLAKGKTDVLSKSKKPLATSRPMTQKSKFEKEEEARKRMEELVIERQKRIAERTAASGAATKKVPVASPKQKPQSITQISPKLGITNSAKTRQIKV